MYYSCHCIKRNGLQHDCRRTGCGGEPACLMLPDPLCAPSQLARARGLADPAPLAAHMRAQSGGGGGVSSESGSGSGKRFIVCELKGITPDVSSNKGGKCCKCPCPQTQAPMQSSSFRACTCPGHGSQPARKPEIATISQPVTVTNNQPNQPKKCLCATSDESSPENQLSMFVFDEETIAKIMKSFDEKKVEKDKPERGGHGRKTPKPTVKEEPCTRPGCIHWQPPPPCVWDAPCKADCFEAHPGIQPGRNKYMSGGMIEGGAGRGGGSQGQRSGVVMLTPQFTSNQ